MMMSFFCKRITSFSNSNSSSSRDSSRPPRNILSPVGGLSFIAVATEIHRPANVVESAAVKLMKPVSCSEAKEEERRDPGGIGFLDDVGGGVDGLMSCTESLGFESSDERSNDDRMEEEEVSRSRLTPPSRWKKTTARARTYPPPLSSLTRNGKPSFFLKPVRKDGRLQLVEVRIDRPEILRATREDGRLRLQLIRSEPHHPQEEEEEEQVQPCNEAIKEKAEAKPAAEPETTEEEEEQVQPCNEAIKEKVEAKPAAEPETAEEEEEQVQPCNEAIKEKVAKPAAEPETTEEEEEEEEKELKEENVRKWRLSVPSGDGFRRCKELINPHREHHHNLPLWSNPCVPTR